MERYDKNDWKMVWGDILIGKGIGETPFYTEDIDSLKTMCKYVGWEAVFAAQEVLDEGN